MMDVAMRAYYERRAPEYDDWWNGTGLFATRDRPGWHEEVDAILALLESLPPARTLDVACGTGFLTRHLPGDVEAVDQSPRMAEIARSRGIAARVGDASRLVGDYERLFTSHFYGHLLPGQRAHFLAQARAVASELIVCDSAGDDEQWQERTLNDGSTHSVYKRWFTGDGLAEELGGGQVLHDGRWFVVVRAEVGPRA
jgi:demethylmenaquinone methyltransferase/2-methoxy-6-polyprenyl-1,4-benzoquinol methylase